MAFALFFPSLVSGPVKRYEKFEEQSKNLIFKSGYFYYGILFIILGLAQKLLVADNFIPLTKGLFDPVNVTSSLSLIKQLYFYSFRIYFDFSGMSHIAIGSGLMFGFILPRNFYYPYLSQNLSEFWQRWHISLSSWIKDYLYIPLGRNRRGLLFSLFNTRCKRIESNFI